VKNTVSSVYFGSLPHRQLRKGWRFFHDCWWCSLPHRQLRNDV